MTETPKEQNSQEKQYAERTLLQQSIEDARTLLAFASSNSGKTSITELDGFESAIQGAATRDAPTEALEKFWTQYRGVVAALHPITAQSIRATRGLQARRLWSVRGGLAFACILVFLSIISIQIISGYGSAYRQSLDKNTNAAKELQGKKIQETLRFDERKGTLEILKSGQKPAAEEVSKREKAMEESQIVLKTIQEELVSNSNAVEASIGLYRSWYSFEWLPYSSKNKESTGSAHASGVNVEKLKENGALLKDGLQRFGLSILMGLLGTLVYLLRNIEFEVASTTYKGAKASMVSVIGILEPLRNRHLGASGSL